MNSGEGGTGPSSAGVDFGVEAFAVWEAAAFARTAAPPFTEREPGWGGDVDCPLPGLWRVAEGLGVVFPPEPTVVQTPPTGGPEAV